MSFWPKTRGTPERSVSNTRSTPRSARSTPTAPTRSFERVIEALSEGAHYALVSDAGTPLVSDPGARLVAEAAAAGVTVAAVPGPSAVLAALCVSGLSSRRFTFEGFIARSGKARRDALARIAGSDATTVLFESPHRLHATLAELEGGGRSRSAEPPSVES